MSQFWTSNFWADGFWADNFWVGQSSAAGAGKSKRKREALSDVKEASRLALLRRRKREILDAERDKAQEIAAPIAAQATKTRLFKIDKELEQIHDEITKLETHIEASRKKRRNRDKLATLLLMD